MVFFVSHARAIHTSTRMHTHTPTGGCGCFPLLPLSPSCRRGRPHRGGSGGRRGRPTKGRDTPHTHTQESGGRPRDGPILWRALRPPLCTTLHRTPNTTLHKTLGATIAPTPGHHPLHEEAHSAAHGRFARACTRLFGHSLCAATVPRQCYTPLCTCTRPRTLRNHCARLSGRFTDLVT